MKITTVTISPKKGESLTLRFQIIQEIPYPDITSHGYSLDWRNTGGLFPSYNHPAEGIGEAYNCYLLAEGVDNPVGNSRTEHAGYEGRPGSFSLRGVDMGELQIRLYRNGAHHYADIKVRGFNSPTPGESAFIEAQIVAPLRAFVETNKEALRENAIARIKTNMSARIGEARKELDALESKISTAKF